MSAGPASLSAVSGLIGRLVDYVGIAVPVVIVGGAVATIVGVSLNWYRRTIGEQARPREPSSTRRITVARMIAALDSTGSA